MAEGTPAPWFDDATAPGLPRPEARWIRAADGIRLRTALWRPEGAARGSVLIFPGRTEYVEKYAPPAAALLARGYAALAIDWRGQGLAGRLAGPAALGHVGRFADYQRDVAALVAQARAAGLPRPWHLLAHSMGGAIGLRALFSELEVRSAAFSAPMWGIVIPPRRRPLAWALSTAARIARMDARFAPGQTAASYVATAPFAGNALTRDPQMFGLMQQQLALHPELALGGASLGWLGAALWELRALAARPAPALPALTFLGSDETVVEPGPIRARMAHWPDGALVDFAGARHELLMELPEVRDPVLDRAAALFDRYG
ncbi:MAG: alpha/beta hydrolase [Rubellimicrobium sp.]|nr:alpha/beta hydrolase [Rubellimicrobium sp.]